MLYVNRAGVSIFSQNAKNDFINYNSQPGPWNIASIRESKSGKVKMDYKTVISMVSRNSSLEDSFL